MKTCKDGCEHAVFCRSFGEYKCTLKQKRIYNTSKPCDEYKEKKKDAKEKKCQCLVCMTEGYIEDDDQ